SGQVCRRLPVFGRACVARPNQARLFGVLGDPVDHSLSPAMHNAAFAAARLPHVYLRYRVPAALLPDAVREAKALRMGGLNLTVPLQEAVLHLLRAATRDAERIGVGKTVLFPPRGLGFAEATLVVITAPLGLAGGGPRVRDAAAPRGCLFVDLVYAARPTPFLAGAARAGRPTLGGAHMLLHQGALAFEAWTGR